MNLEKIVRVLQKKYKIKPWRGKPFEVLISTILSQRTKDEVTRKCARKLLNVANTPEKILKLDERKIRELIYPVGFYRQKAKKIKKICKILIEKYGGKVPKKREELLKLPGVGDKTASCVLSYGFGISTIPVDTHVNRISKRLGIVNEKNSPEETRKTLEKTLPKKLYGIVNFLFISFGRDICRPIKPRCNICPIKEVCKYYKKFKKIRK